MQRVSGGTIMFSTAAGLAECTAVTTPEDSQPTQAGFTREERDDRHGIRAVS